MFPETIHDSASIRQPECIQVQHGRVKNNHMSVRRMIGKYNYKVILTKILNLKIKNTAGLLGSMAWYRRQNSIFSRFNFHFSDCRFSLLCHTVIIKSIQKINSRIEEAKEQSYSNRLAKIQVCAMFRAGDILRNVLLKGRRHVCVPLSGTNMAAGS